MKTKLLVISAVSALSVLSSCGDDGGSGSASGVAGDTLVKDVTDAESVKVCKWDFKQIVAATSSVSVRQACTSDIAPESSTTAECKEDVEDCIKDGEEEDGELEEDCDDQDAPDVAAGCSAITVSDYETCVKAIISGAKKLINSASCDNAGEEPDEDDAAANLPTNCKVILNKCPSILPDIIRPDNSVPGNDDLAE